MGDTYDEAKLKETFNNYVAQGASTSSGLSNKNFAKLCKDCKVVDGKKLSNADVDITFSKHKTKGQQNINFKEFHAILLEMGKKRFGQGNESQLLNLVQGKSPLAKGTTKTSKTGGVDKMTDASLYTGSHKERFDADGKGKGIDGRENRVENKGYVGAYKGEGTYKGTD